MEEIENVEPEVLDDISKIETFTRDDFLRGTAPYDFVYLFHKDKFKFSQVKELVSIRAKEVKVNGFNSKFKDYMGRYHPEIKPVYANFTEFEGQTLELACGKYVCRDDVCFENNFGDIVEVCNHPIMPVERWVNIDDNTEKLKIRYRKGYVWREITVDKEVLASASKITALAKYGIAVNSENAKYLVKYMTDIESLNFDMIEEKKSVVRLGWIKGYGFSPYVDSLIFDGEESFRDMFRKINYVGDFDKWLELAAMVRREKDPSARIVLAASFASALVEPCDCLPFFVHLWGTSGGGKTVAALFACSVWASPVLGDYMKTFNSTAVSQELTAGFLNSMPLAYDEFQIEKNKKNHDDMVYKLCEGVGRDRGKKTGGLQKLNTWRNTILTTGEQPITTETSGGGAMNRIVEIECNGRTVISNPVELVSKMKDQYGGAGQLFVKYLQEDGVLDEVRETRLKYMKKFSQYSDVTDKQAMAASLILTADEITEALMFRDGIRLSIDDIKPFLVTKTDIDINKRCYEFLNDFVVANYAKFNPANNDNYSGEIYGDAREDYVYFIKSKFDQILTDNGYNARAFLSWAARNELIKRNKRQFSISHRMPHTGTTCSCIALIRTADDGYMTDFTDLPI